MAAASYRSGDRLRDERQDLTHDYSRRNDVLHTEIITPGNAPEWSQDREQLWNRADAAEKRKDARTAKECTVALPRELSLEQQLEVLREFVRENFTERGLVADVAIHSPMARDGLQQPHAHIMVTTRPLDAAEFGKGKDRTLDSPQGIAELRQSWGQQFNQGLERAGCEQRVDHRSLETQAREAEAIARDPLQDLQTRQEADLKCLKTDRDPEPKIGPTAQRMDREGRGDHSHALKDALSAREARNGLEAIASHWEQTRDAIRIIKNPGPALAKEALRNVSPELAKGVGAVGMILGIAKALDGDSMELDLLPTRGRSRGPTMGM